MEERKNYHINELMKKHEKAFGEIKNYYNDITHNNLDLIKSLKEEASALSPHSRKAVLVVVFAVGKHACITRGRSQAVP